MVGRREIKFLDGDDNFYNYWHGQTKIFCGSYNFENKRPDSTRIFYAYAGLHQVIRPMTYTSQQDSGCTDGI